MQSLSIIEPNKALQQIARSIPAKNITKTISQLNEIQENCQARLSDPLAFRDLIFTRAMASYFDQEKQFNHIYLKEFDVPQITLFSLLMKAYPMVRLTHQIANQHMVGFLRRQKQAILVDIGVGTGHQLCEVLARLYADPTSCLQRLRIIGIEPYESALQEAQKQIENSGFGDKIKIEFVAVKEFAENLSLEDIISWKRKENLPVIVNASFVLHHIRTQVQRLHVLELFNDAGVAALLISEPNVDHFEPNYTVRFDNCYRHFSLCYEIIDQLEISVAEKSALKLFFSREIDDILGNAEEHRVEKHQLMADWLSLCRKAGFVPRLKYTDMKTVGELGIELDYLEEAYWGVCYKKEATIGVTYLEIDKGK